MGRWSGGPRSGVSESVDARGGLRWVLAVTLGIGLTSAPLDGREVPFSAQKVITTATDGARWVYPADLDGDGDLDVLSASVTDDEIAWYENTDGAGTFGAQQVITTLADGATAVFSADLDGDGDLDVLSASSSDDEIAWYENTDGAGTFGPQQVITTLADGAESVFSADVDGDGDLDVLSASRIDNDIAWYENTDGAGTFGPKQVIEGLALGARSVFSADIDGDGDLDVLSASRNDDKIAWYENTNGAGTFGAQQVITTSAAAATSVFSSDVDGDGDLDVLSASFDDGKIAWYENTNGAGTFSAQKVISVLATGAFSVFSADVDGDGDLDVLSASAYAVAGGHRVAWYENLDGAGTFGPQRLITTLAVWPMSVFSADVDGDGDLDVLSASLTDDKIAWYENETIHRSALFPAQQVITNLADGAQAVFSADVDGDGDPDVLSASSSDGKIAWYENTNGTGTFGAQQAITTATSSAISVHSADIDGDGDLDVLSASSGDDKIAWYKNLNGAGLFGTQQVITTLADLARSVFSADLDGDGDLDVLSASANDDKIAWYENTNGAGAFGAQQVITTLADGARSVYSSDLDGDGDLDVLSSSLNDGKIAWYENTDGAGTFGAQQVITTLASGARSVSSSDVDGDGDLDVLSASFNDDEIAWYENTDGAGTFGAQQLITTLANGATSVFSADIDGDGDLDVLSASFIDDEIAWYENTDGAGTFGAQQLITTLANGATSVFSVDVDGDGDPDVLSSSSSDDEIAWYENQGGQFSLVTTDVAQGTVANNQVEDVLAIRVTHEGRAGDSPLELASLELRLTDGATTALTEAQALALLKTVRVYLDEGDGVFGAGDSLVVSTTDFSSITANGDGVLTVPFVDGDANVAVAFGTPKTFLVVVEMTTDAESQTPSAFAVEHRTESSSQAEDASADVELDLEFVANVQGQKVSTSLSSTTCQAPFDLHLESRTVTSAVICEAGTVLTAGSQVTVMSPGNLTLRAGEEVHLGIDFSVQSGDFTAELVPSLVPPSSP